MKRPSNSDGDGEAQGFMREPTSPPSLRSAAGGTVIQFPSPAAFAGAREGAGVSSASASSTFIPLGVPALAVVMRIKQGLPKISMPPRLREEEEPTSAADQSAGDLG